MSLFVVKYHDLSQNFVIGRKMTLFLVKCPSLSKNVVKCQSLFVGKCHMSFFVVKCRDSSEKVAFRCKMLNVVICRKISYPKCCYWW